MTFHVKLKGRLCYEEPAAATAAHVAMMQGRDDNWMLRDGARVEGSSILFEFDNQLANSSASDHVDSTEFGIHKAIETAVTGSVTYSHEGGYQRVDTALSRPYWSRRWENGQIGFHEVKPNDLLVANIASIESKSALRVLLPLCGKSPDLAWLAARGHEIVGVEFAWQAVRAFFDEQDLDPDIELLGRDRKMSGNGVALIAGDFFHLGPDQLGTFDVIYDRAALIALEPSTRQDYVAHCRRLLRPNGKLLLVALAYEQKECFGPPWSVDESMVRQLYAPMCVEVLQTRTLPALERFAKAGLVHMTETAYLLTE